MAKKKSAKSKNSASKVAPKTAKSDSIVDSINTEEFAEVISTATQPILLKLCRLCEAKDGPFLNIFDADKVIAKKIEDLMPLAIEENDDLPHKICFRCSAKVEELYEFVQKCIKTQVSLRKAVGKMSLGTKTKHRTLWEEKLNQSNMSNDDICNALIKKAMEGIKDIPLKSDSMNDDQPILGKNIKNDSPAPDNDKDVKKSDLKRKDTEILSVSKEQVAKNDQRSLNTRVSRSSNNEELLDSLVIRSKRGKQIPAYSSDSDNNENSDKGNKRKPVVKEPETAHEAEVTEKEEKPAEPIPDKKPFDIMDHISMIKVNGVGVLFQCKLCNRNFLKKEVVMSHACAKNGGPKQEVIPEYVPHNPPKMPVVKYINTKIEGLHAKAALVKENPIVLDEEPAPSAPVKSRPKVGPASKVKKTDIETKTSPSTSTTNVHPTTTSQVTAAPTLQLPALPSLNSRYKLVSGPNNTFTLVEEKVAENTEYVSSDDSNSSIPKADKQKKKPNPKSDNAANFKGKKSTGNFLNEKSIESSKMSAPSGMPYPVGLIKRPMEHTTDYTPPATDSMAFTTPAMKKQSYTIVQTGNPSKLLLSTKTKAETDDVPKKRTRRQRADAEDENTGQPFSVTLEDNTPSKDPGFFTFINVDPLLQPSYVLPTDNIIQESQISTSTAINNMQPSASKDKDKDKYPCNMCNEQFSREKKLLAHIHSHYNKMDEEDQLREKTLRKRVKKS